MLILDGGLGSELEELGSNISGLHLWSASLLLNNDSNHPIQQVHSLYLNSGANIITTSTYQAYIPTSFLPPPPNISENDLIQSFYKAMQLATDAKNSLNSKSIIAASLGSFGAVLTTGAEFTGDFNGISSPHLEEFHYTRLLVVLKTKPDMLAFETIPSLFEAKAIANVLLKLKSLDIYLPPTWVSFSCNSNTTTCSGDLFAECVTVFDDLDVVEYVGMNCTKPQYCLDLITIAKKSTFKKIICYPNKGEVWDAIKHEWVQDSTYGTEAYVKLAKEWEKAGASIIGGCCRIRPMHIEALAKHVNKK